jgi:hypothetical protein
MLTKSEKNFIEAWQFKLCNAKKMKRDFFCCEKIEILSKKEETIK